MSAALLADTKKALACNHQVNLHHAFIMYIVVDAFLSSHTT
jgi:hypothetical protein